MSEPVYSYAVLRSSSFRGFASILSMLLIANVAMAAVAANKTDKTGPTTSTLRISCEGVGGVEISIDGQYKGDCPLDVTVKAGSHRVVAVRNSGAGPRNLEQTVRIGEGVAKRVELPFDSDVTGNSPLPSAGGIDVATVKQLRYEASMKEYERRILECKPKFDDEVRRVRQEAREAFNDHKSACIRFWGEYESNCGQWDAESRALLERRWQTENKLKYLEIGNDAAGDWCRKQFSPPLRPFILEGY